MTYQRVNRAWLRRVGRADHPCRLRDPTLSSPCPSSRLALQCLLSPYAQTGMSRVWAGWGSVSQCGFQWRRTEPGGMICSANTSKIGHKSIRMRLLYEPPSKCLGMILLQRKDRSGTMDRPRRHAMRRILCRISNVQAVLRSGASAL